MAPMVAVKASTETRNMSAGTLANTAFLQLASSRQEKMRCQIGCITKTRQKVGNSTFIASLKELPRKLSFSGGRAATMPEMPPAASMTNGVDSSLAALPRSCGAGAASGWLDSPSRLICVADRASRWRGHIACAASRSTRP